MQRVYGHDVLIRPELLTDDRSWKSRFTYNTTLGLMYAVPLGVMAALYNHRKIIDMVRVVRLSRRPQQQGIVQQT